MGGLGAGKRQRKGLSARRGQAGRAAGEEAALGIVGEGDLARDGQLVMAGGGVDGFVKRNGFQFEIFAGAAQGTLFPHHGGKLIGSLALGALLLPGLLPVLQTVEALL